MNNENAPRAWAQRRRQGRLVRKARKTLARRDRLARVIKEGSYPVIEPGVNQALDDGENKRGREAEH